MQLNLIDWIQIPVVSRNAVLI